ncbi:hypothetical protein ACFROC_03665 [Nocardia tengchongensis]|uniref:hypothetical protein n=1 Tax=Nocardia tengchongensis TaxID=2055889 RepID=UPI0036845965
MTPVGEAGAGHARVVVGVDPASGLAFTCSQLTVNDGTTYPAGGDSREDVLSFEGVTIDSEVNPELSVEVVAGEQASEEPAVVSFVVGLASCAVPVTIVNSTEE